MASKFEAGNQRDEWNGRGDVIRRVEADSR